MVPDADCLTDEQRGNVGFFDRFRRGPELAVKNPRVFTLPYSGMKVAAVRGDEIWVRSGFVGVQIVALEAKTGAIRHQLQMPSQEHRDWRLLFAKGSVAGNAGTGVCCVSRESGAVVWTQANALLLAATPRGFIVAVNRGRRASSLIERREDGSVRELVEAKCGQHELSAVAVDGAVFAIVGEHLVRIPLSAEGAPVVTTPLGTGKRSSRVFTFRDHALVVDAQETQLGGQTRFLLAQAAGGALKELAVVPSFISPRVAATSSEVFVAVSPDGETTRTCWVVPLDGSGGGGGRSVPAETEVCASASAVAIGRRGVATLWSKTPAGLSTCDVSLPEQAFPAVGLGERELCFVVHTSLFVHGVASLLWAPVPPFASEARQAEGRNLQHLERARDQLGFSISPLLEKVLRQTDTDEAFRRWLDQLSILIEVTGKSTAWEGADPCLLGLAGSGGGDVVAFYVFPPGLPAGAPLPMVDWWHETNEVSWLSPDFDTWFATRLASEREASPEVVALVLERLGLPAEFAKSAVVAAAAPAWFTADPTTDTEERRLVHSLRTMREDAATRERLRTVYAELGWAWHGENLDD